MGYNSVADITGLSSSI